MYDVREEDALNGLWKQALPASDCKGGASLCA